MLEVSVEDKVVTWVKKQGGKCIKFTPMGDVAWPDRIVVLPGGFQCWVELKRPGKEPSAYQYYRIGTLNRLGVQAFWGSDPNFVIKELNRRWKENTSYHTPTNSEA